MPRRRFENSNFPKYQSFLLLHKFQAGNDDISVTATACFENDFDISVILCKVSKNRCLGAKPAK